LQTTAPRRLARVVAASAAATALALALVAPAPAAEPGDATPRADAALDWLAGELTDNDGMLTVSFDGEAFADQGLTIDALLALEAGGHGDDPAMALGQQALGSELVPYLTGFSTEPADRSANAVAKTLLLEEVTGTDVSAAYDLEADLRSLLATEGDEVGRVNDTDLLGYGNYANGIGQALAVLALDRTGGGVPADAVDFLLSQQCGDGSFRLYYYGYTISFDPFEVVDDVTCTDAADGDADATAFALMALLAVPSSAGVDAAIAAAVDHLEDLQDASGGVLGTGAVNSNTTGVAAAALRAAGATAAADEGAAFVAGIQVADDCAELGAIAYDQAAFDAGLAADRGQWSRASAQGVLALGLPDYGHIGVTAPVTAGLADLTCAAPPPPPVPPTGTPTIHLASPTVVAGGLLEGTASGFEPRSEVSGTLFSTPTVLGTTTTDATGALSFAYVVPADVEPGLHRFELAATSGEAASVEVEVLGIEAPGTLAMTGSSNGPLVVIGSALLLAGASLVRAGRRRVV
jgi:hypothetical protein